MGRSSKGVEFEAGSIVGLADLGSLGEQVVQLFRRDRYPRAGRRSERVVLGGLHAVHVGRQCLHLLLRLAQGVSEGGVGAAARDELDEVVHACLGAVQFDLLEAQLLRDVREHLLHLDRRSLVNLLQELGVEHLLVERRIAWGRLRTAG